MSIKKKTETQLENLSSENSELSEQLHQLDLKVTAQKVSNFDLNQSYKESTFLGYSLLKLLFVVFTIHIMILVYIY